MLNVVKHHISFIIFLFSEKKVILGILRVIFRFAQNDSLLLATHGIILRFVFIIENGGMV